MFYEETKNAPKMEKQMDGKKNPWLDVLVLLEGALHSWGASLALHSLPMSRDSLTWKKDWKVSSLLLWNGFLLGNGNINNIHI